LKKGAAATQLEQKVDIAARTRRVEERVEVEGELVFVGYGALAPEYEWDDFKGFDVRDKILLVLVNDPPGEDIFGGKAMTYYGRWSYKFEIAAELGAAGAFVIHETEPAGYPWEVISDWGAEQQFVLATSSDDGDLLGAEGWIHVDAMRRVFEMAGMDFEEMKQAAMDRSFEPVGLGVTMSVALQNSIRELESANVVAKLQGQQSPDEWIIYTAHWDHLGIDPERTGDNIFNGAHDNASGTAGLLEIAQAFARLDEAPARSVLFLAVTAEEQGLLGSRHYGRNPLYPPKNTVAVINMDGLNLLGPTRDITVVGMGQSELDGLATRLASQQGRILRPDPEPEKGSYYRSDHFEFAKVGIPAFYPEAGIEFINKPEGWGIEMREKYTREDYHKPSDEVKDYWDLSGAVEDLELFYLMGYELATGAEWPEWSEKSEFRPTREKQRSP
jgi:Zn-dependent M28 family amino/carboxypeptidase